MVGTTLLHYRVLRPLGQGGMGEVYLAEDLHLKRQVALKVLPEAVRNDPNGLRRFRTEAEAAAKLNHPNIAQIYSIEETNGVLFITMEFVDGQPLHQHIPHEGLLLARFFEWFVPLSDALTHAHEHGVTHRDLKPGNIMIRTDGVPKILDFGLARIKRPEPGDVDHDAPTVSMGALKSLTQRGTVLGTPAYMSPEQARGQEVDERTDLFSFGVVLYEALAGQRPFDGEDYVAIISSIVKDEPTPVTALKPAVPRDLGRLVRKCLQKEVGNRYQTAREVRNDLTEVKADVDAGTVLVDARTIPPPPAPAPPKPVPVWRRTPALAGAAALVALLVALATWFTGERVRKPPEPLLRKFQIPVEGGINPAPAISPDGTMVAYVQGGRLWVRRLDRVDAQEIPDSDGADDPFWSPQSDFVGYFASGTLKKVSAQGGPSTMLCKLSLGNAGATWRPDGTIVFSQVGTIGFSQVPGGLFEVSGQGGEPRSVLKPDSTRKEVWFVSPHVLPDGRTLVFSVRAQNTSNDLVVQGGDTRRSLLHVSPGEGLSVPVYAPSGHLLYERFANGRIDVWAVAFSRSSLTTTGEPFLVAQNAEWPSVSADGTLVYQAAAGTGSRQLVWVDRSGKVQGTIGQPQDGILTPALSPDGRRVAVMGTESGNTDIWIHDVERGTKTRLTTDPDNDAEPVWSPAGDQVAFASYRSGAGDLYLQAADGSGEAHLLVTGPLNDGQNGDWSRDGKYLIYHVYGPNRGLALGRDLWYLPMTGDRKPVPFLQTSFEEGCAVFSPDGRYVAYMSDESGQWEIYVKRFPTGAGRWQVSVKGGVYPKWNGKGDELFYVEGNRLMAVKVDIRAEFRAELPQPLFTGEQVGALLYNESAPSNLEETYDVTPDGKRFVVIQPVGGGAVTTITVVQNWVREFQKR